MVSLQTLSCSISMLQVCRSAGYFEHALYVAQASKQPAIYLDILVEDCRKWEEALAFLGGEPREEAATALKKYGKVSSLPPIHPFPLPGTPSYLLSKKLEQCYLEGISDSQRLHASAICGLLIRWLSPPSHQGLNQGGKF